MIEPSKINVLFVAGFGPIVQDPAASRRFYSDILGLPFEEDADGYMHTGAVDGVKHLARPLLIGRVRRSHHEQGPFVIRISREVGVKSYPPPTPAKQVR